MLISVHLPKTAGSSFAALLAVAFVDRLALDYVDQPIHQSPVQRKTRALMGAKAPRPELTGLACVHGHFLPLKYRDQLNRGAQFVTWFREPLDRLQSHYGFWQSHYDPATAGRVHRQMMDEQWSFERFALGPELRDIYSLFLWRFPLERFSFIGLFEALSQDTVRFTDEFLGAVSNLPRLNEGGQAPLDIDSDLRERIYTWHARDVALYQQACTIREAQFQRWQSNRRG
ncbi:conserved hypothetical protein [Luminiphilus syltensis NOR5-1B]|uniref:Sulfotransferase family protein n=1 Tax=Luminiphilus syltensis NOR5-1B TaxID=565045 RepID=B8KWZ5_9GAMM|nr:hypothetical protein [Luminiphilus syltensis]EED35866.1 conserved hypothetical protein [Luminiphilus syltensis NOR5-1B]